ncbi:sulfite exporter TauE/SafE family protein [Capnocytophaga cynodegmi]|uniref:sulfite exporter TauE/SafE family protein n=1 Tax=Capnocytophaga cynodegmi TaxID=28189 RepID=UPI00385DF7DD
MFYTAFILGLLGSFHCVGMCGPLTLILPLEHRKPIKKAFQITSYHVGKAMAYVSLGLVFGLLGKGLFIREYQQIFSIIVGSLMILIVLLSFVNIKMNLLTKPIYFLIGKVKYALSQQLKRKNSLSIFFIGFFNGFLPCGLVYMALFGALAQTELSHSAIYMFAFALGTVPLMTATIYLGNFLSQKTKKYIQKAIPFVIIIIGGLFILRGLALGIPYISPSNMNLMIKADADCIVPTPK